MDKILFIAPFFIGLTTSNCQKDVIPDIDALSAKNTPYIKQINSHPALLYLPEKDKTQKTLDPMSPVFLYSPSNEQNARLDSTERRNRTLLVF
ncbi:hypothetical protein [Azomonas macrocytogenes]|uniref:Uncharacterized protein n=1 Tax=Azomonas macrocytogenes TaxID=69962 RepID=A0A839T1X2_AZOMA|nr:hypothetical protein [Azomonas macrocytogenes]MBB3103557.1 hypothetical protein [Azomonas macrocytogenes]